MKSSNFFCVKSFICLLVFIGYYYIGLIAQELPTQYREPFSESFPIRKQQHLELNDYLNKILGEEAEKSLTFFKPDFSSIEKYQKSIIQYRKQFFGTLGYPPPKIKVGTKPKITKVGEDVACVIYRVWLEVVEGVEAYGIYMVPKNIKGKSPLLISVHGGSGCPEAICDLDTREPYHAMGREAVKRGYIVWAPCLPNQVTYGGDPVIEGADRYIIERKAKLVGTSFEAIHIYKIIRSTEVLIKERPEIDADKIGMTGLSWGGRFTLITTASWPLIKACAPAGFFMDKELSFERAVEIKTDRPVDTDVFSSFGNAQIVGLICPRPIMIQMGVKDEVVKLENARREIEKAGSYYKKLGISDKFLFLEHPAGHEFDIENLFAFFDKYLKK
jgi:hypothetical protein